MHVWPFVTVALVVVLTPGPDMVLVTKNALRHGRRAAVATAFGSCAGTGCWLVATVVGLANLLAASKTAFSIVRLAGAGYLIVLGLQALLASVLSNDRSDVEELATALPGGATAFRQGLISNLLNPKIAIFFTSLLPQFVGSHPSTEKLLELGALFDVLGVLWLVPYAATLASSSSLLGRPWLKRGFERTAGIALVGFGTRLTLESWRVL